MRGILVLLLVAGLSGSVRADDTEPPVTFHKGQFGVSARVGLGVHPGAMSIDAGVLMPA